MEEHRLSENFSEKQNETDTANTSKSSSEEGIINDNIPSKPAAAKAISLQAIICGVQTDSGRWPQEAFKAVLQRFNRMPRGGWNTAHEMFCKKFQVSMSLLDLTLRKKQGTP